MKKGSLNKVYEFLRPYLLSLTFCFILMLLATFFSLLPYYVLILLTNNVLIPIQNHTSFEMTNIYLYLGCFLFSALLAFIFSWTKNYYLSKNSELITYDLRLTLYKHLMSLSLDYFSRQRVGELISRVGNETDELNLFISINLLDFIQDLLILIGIFMVVLFINFKIALMNLLFMPITFLFIFKIKDKLYFALNESTRIWSKIIGYLGESLQAIKTIKAFNQEENSFRYFMFLNKRNLLVNFYLNKVWSIFSPTTVLFNEINLVFVWGFGIYLLYHQQLNLGELTGLIAYLNKFYARSESISRFFESYKKMTVKLHRAMEILEKKSSLSQPEHPIYLKDVKGSLSIQNISFSYENDLVLKNISLDIKPFQKIAFVGYSGSGKSTLMNLICRFFDPIEGNIFLDGINIKSIDNNDYHKHIAIVTQEPFMFYGTIADNIAYGKKDATPEEIIHAARLANCHEFIIKKPLGYDTVIFENGQILSGGERQRISIARAILTQPKILILDEASSAIDVESERLFNKSLEFLSATTTTLVISHRLSNLHKFDRICFINNGEIIECGSHQELMLLKGHYHSFIQVHEELHKDQLI